MKHKMKIGKQAAIFFLLTVISFPGSGQNQLPRKSEEKNTAAWRLDISELQLVSDTEEKEREAYQSHIRLLARNGSFEEMQSELEKIRSQKTRFASGYWKLRAFYVAFGDYEKISQETGYPVLINALKKWATNQPTAIAPRIALAEAYHGYAWQARGSGWASQVTPEGEALMGARMKMGFEWLHEAQALQQKAEDPAFYAMAMRSFLGANVSRQTYESYFEAGIKNAPDYSAQYEYKAYYLLPRWYGQEGEWEKFARAMSRRSEIPDSREIFARIAMYLRDIGCFYKEFSYDDQSWEELKQSFHAIQERYPESLEVKSILCLMALKMCDYKEARKQMSLLQGKVDLSVWGSKTNFIKGAAWLSLKDAELETCRQEFKKKQQR